MVRVVLFLNIPTRPPSRRLTSEERSQLVAEARTATSSLLEQLVPLLAAAGAHRVDDGELAPLGGSRAGMDFPASTRQDGTQGPPCAQEKPAWTRGRDCSCGCCWPACSSRRWAACSAPSPAPLPGATGGRPVRRWDWVSPGPS